MAYDPYNWYYAATGAAPSYSQSPYYYDRRPTTTSSLFDNNNPYTSYYAAAAAPWYSHSQGPFPYYYHRPTTTSSLLDDLLRVSTGDVSLPVSRGRVVDAKPVVPEKAPKNRKPGKKAKNRKHKHKKKSIPIHVDGLDDEVAGELTLAELFVDAEHGGEIEVMAGVTETEVDAAAEEAVPAASDRANSNSDDDKPDGSSDADAEWEIVKDEEEPAAAACPEAPRHDPAPAAAGQEIAGAADAGAGIVVDPGKLMEMVVALCERNAEQCALIGALAERMDALERTLRRA